MDNRRSSNNTEQIRIKANILTPTTNKSPLAENSISDDKLVSVTKRVLANLSNGSTFFEHNPRVQLPSFDRKEFTVGDLLGSGEFGEVLEVTNFHTNEQCSCYLCDETVENNPAKEGPPCHSIIISDDTMPSHQRKTGSCNYLHRFNSHRFNSLLSKSSPVGESITLATDNLENVSDYGDLEDMYCDNRHRHGYEDGGPTLKRAFMQAHCKRKEVARFAVKRLHHNVSKFDATIDLACEATFLSSICHPNIIKIRATVGKLGHPDFMIVIDRLLLTLERKIEKWKGAHHQFKGRCLGYLHYKKEDLQELMAERATALFQIARALKYLHNKKIVYRDLNPDNVAFDFRGDAKIFDFGLVRELKPVDLVEPPNAYDLKGLTGSRRYMAPEVVKCKPYGTSADVYSFGILSWQVFALKTPFARFDTNKHHESVIKKGKRPRPISSLPATIQSMMVDCWEEDQQKRPKFKQICQILRTEISLIKVAQ